MEQDSDDKLAVICHTDQLCKNLFHLKSIWTTLLPTNLCGTSPNLCKTPRILSNLHGNQKMFTILVENSHSKQPCIQVLEWKQRKCGKLFKASSPAVGIYTHKNGVKIRRVICRVASIFICLLSPPLVSVPSGLFMRHKFRSRELFSPFLPRFSY